MTEQLRAGLRLKSNVNRWAECRKAHRHCSEEGQITLLLLVEPGIDGGQENFAHLGIVPAAKFSGVGMKLWGCSSGFVLDRSSPAMGFVRHGLILMWKNLTGLRKALTSTRCTLGLLLSPSRPTLVPDLINALLNVWAQKHHRILWKAFREQCKLS